MCITIWLHSINFPLTITLNFHISYMGQSFQHGIVICLTHLGMFSYLKSLCLFVVLFFMFTYFEFCYNKCQTLKSISLWGGGPSHSETTTTSHIQNVKYVLRRRGALVFLNVPLQNRNNKKYSCKQLPGEALS